MAAARTIIATFTVACAALAGCTSGPDPLLPVRQRVASAVADDGIRTHAAASLADAQRTLKLAADAGEPAVRDHFAYLTGKNLDIAEAVLARRQAEQELTALQRQAVSRDAEPAPKAGQDAPQGAHQAAPIETTPTKPPPPEPQPPEPARSAALTIPDLSFDSGTAGLSPGAKRRLDPLVASLRGDPGLSALVEGYTDDTGGREANLRISLSRAKAVKDYLIGQGIAADRIQTLGHGEQYPIASNATAEGRSINRRIEIVVHSAGSPSKQDARRR